MTLISVTQAHIDSALDYHDDSVDPVALAIGDWLHSIGKPSWFVLCQADTIELCSGTRSYPDSGDVVVDAVVELEIPMNVKVGNWLALWYTSMWNEDELQLTAPFDFELPNDTLGRINALDTVDNP